MIQKKAGLAARQVVGIQGGKGVLGERLLWVADLWTNSSLMSASGGKAAIKSARNHDF